MRTLLGLAVALFLLWLGLFAWGYVHERSHAFVGIDVEDAAVAQALGESVPPAWLAFDDAAGREIGRAERRQGIWRVVHPDPAIGDCTAVEGLGGDGFARCNAALSADTARWIARVARARLRIGDCTLAPAPVTLAVSRGDTGAWWFPLQHGFGLPSQWASVRVTVDSRQCMPPPS